MPEAPWIPLTCVWEVTLGCNCRCLHCGSSAGSPRDRELDTTEAVALIGELADLGCESVTLSGGEPLLRPDWPLLAAAIRREGMRAELITNGLCAAAQADRIAEVGFYGVTFSVDGPREVHDTLRGIPGAFDSLLESARAVRERGVRIGAVTQVNRANRGRLFQIHALLVEHGFAGWQVQLTMAHGRARERSDKLCLEPAELPAMQEELVRVQASSGLFMQIADNIGYMSRHEPWLRTPKGKPLRFWTGCPAGIEVVGITSDGTVRGCLSMPPQADEGSIRQRSFRSIWHDPFGFSYNRRFRVEDLGGPCAGCAFGRVCRGGCRSLAMASSGSPHSNFCCSSHVLGQNRR